MKKMCFLLCCVIVLQSFNACTPKSDDYQVPANFYYGCKEIAYSTPDGVIRPETREGAGFTADVEAFIDAYLLGPVSSDLRRLIPADVYLVSCQTEGDTVSIVFTTQFSRLTGIDLLTACSGLFLSLQDFFGTQLLQVSASGSQLDGKDVLSITANDIVLADTINRNE